jgi:UDP-N-acetylmuramyl pentapeptide phosphotransferase/UDP-N-acetylglucosamine-1-phosphate transferase
MPNVPAYIIYLLCVVTGIAVCSFSIPYIIAVAKVKRLFDRPDGNRKIHKTVVPNLGGIGVVLAYLILAGLFVNTNNDGHWHYIVSASLILFVIGVKDDIVAVTPAMKFAAQIAAAIITVGFADIRLHSLHGLFGLHEIPYWYSVIFSIIGCVFVSNAFNLIDGIDGLVGSVSVLCTASLGSSMALLGNYNGACMAFVLMGAIIGFLKFNISPAKIFMGDSGSLVVGFTVSILCIMFINSYNPATKFGLFVTAAPGALLFGLSILAIPVFDSFRVFITRIAKKKHPFHADKTHLHHFLLDAGFSHTHTVMILVIANLMVISVCLMVQSYNPNLALLAMFALSFGLFSILYYMRKNRLQQAELVRERMLAAAKASELAAANNEERAAQLVSSR